MSVQVDLAGRVALVTGAGSGIGRACAVRLAQAGATVVALDRDESALKELAAQTGVRTAAVDLGDLDAVDALDLDALDLDALGLGVGTDVVDILVNNAGFQHVAPIEQFPPEVFTAILRVMLEAPFRLVRRCLPGMYAQGWGRVINISSVHGVRASAFKSAYVTAKHGLEGLSKVIALEGAPHGVTSNCINPAYVRTPLVEGQIEAQATAHGITPDEVVEKVILAPAAIKRLIEPAEIAELVAYLCSPEASFITGESIMMDGGWTAH